MTDLSARRPASAAGRSRRARPRSTPPPIPSRTSSSTTCCGPRRSPLPRPTFPAVHDEFWKGYLHVNETKYCNVDPDTWGATLHAVAREFCLAGVRRLPRGADGHPGPDPRLVDGRRRPAPDAARRPPQHPRRLHTHHVHENWARRVNILLYLNEEWHEDWGGQLELWDRDMTACQAAGHPGGQPDARLHDLVRQLPRPPRRPDLPARRGPPVDGAVLLHRGGAPVRRATHYRARPEEGAEKGADRAPTGPPWTSTTGSSAGSASPTTRCSGC